MPKSLYKPKITKEGRTAKSIYDSFKGGPVKLIKELDDTDKDKLRNIVEALCLKIKKNKNTFSLESAILDDMSPKVCAIYREVLEFKSTEDLTQVTNFTVHKLCVLMTIAGFKIDEDNFMLYNSMGRFATNFTVSVPEPQPQPQQVVPDSQVIASTATCRKHSEPIDIVYK